MKLQLQQAVGRERLWNAGYIRVWSANFMIFFSFMLLMPLLPLYLSDTFGATRQEIGLVLSGYSVTALVARALSGWLVDSFPRKVVLVTSYCVMALMFGGYMVAGSLLAFMLIRTVHGVPFGATTVANSTVAVDVLPSSRRTEGIGLYGLSNNLAVAVAPSVALAIYGMGGSYNLQFAISMAVALGGWLIVSSLKLKPRSEGIRVESKGSMVKGGKSKLSTLNFSFDRFFLVKGTGESLAVVAYAFSYGVVTTYVTIYGAEELGITSGTGLFFTLMALGLILSRVTGNHSLRQGRIVHNASLGILVAMAGYLLFAGVHTPWAFYTAALIIGLGNGHMFPAFQNMFVNLATNSQRGTANSTLLVSWDIGLGLGTLAGGVTAQYLGFHAAFWAAFLVNAAGTAFYFIHVRGHYLRNRLR